MSAIKRITKNFWVAMAIGSIVGLLTFSFIYIFSFLGYGVLLFAYIFSLVGLILFYKLTSVLNLGWTVLSFFLNLVIWKGEQILLAEKFQDTVLYQVEGITLIFVLAFGSLLFAINKGLLDELFRLSGIEIRDEMIITKIINKKRTDTQ